MKKRLRIESLEDNLAKDMWGDIFEKIEYLPGLKLFKCQYYQGYILNDREFNLDNELKSKLNPMIVVEIYSYRGERFIIERTKKGEAIPDKLKSKYNNKRFDERINFYALTEDSMSILEYYHSEILKYAFINNLDDRCKDYKSVSGYISMKTREAIKELALNAPEFIKKKDKKKAKEYLNKVLRNNLKKVEGEKQKIKEEEVDIIEDKIRQRTEVLCVG